ncbi:methyltransferase [Streptomyces sp. NBC_01294]|uniref:methyltransferase n=1 Tax=Streptomyces sp. NBC_01294 TaxID=2903815 RepID=UPI002DD9BAA3|nr:methyltransferase domain-containing protein [Streptomyces sp. NBC_01294]WRZ61587.1 methyltransferase [Streptomyces sp. NBC_01294]
MADPTVPPPPARARTTPEDGPAVARAELVARLEADGALGPGPVRDALLGLRREVLMPQAYVRRSKPDETPLRWDLLDWAVAADREELLGLLYGGQSVSVQHEGEPILGRVPGPRSGGSMTAMSSTVGMTAGLLQRLDLRPGQRVLDIGTGAGVSAAVACAVAGDAGVVTVDRNPHVTAAARERLAALGYRPTAATGDGQHGWPAQRAYDRTFVSYAVTRVPLAWPEQLAPGGLALATLSTSSPSWPGLAVIARTGAGRLEARVEAVELGHRPAHGGKQIFLNARFRKRIDAGAVDGESTHTTRTGPPPSGARGCGWRWTTSIPGWCGTGVPTAWSSVRPRAGPGSPPAPTAPEGGPSPPTGRGRSGRRSRKPPPAGRPPDPRPPTVCTSNPTKTSGSAPGRDRRSCPGP